MLALSLCFAGCLDVQRDSPAGLDALTSDADTTPGSDAVTGADTSAPDASSPTPDAAAAEPCDEPGATRCSEDHESLEFCGGADLSWSTEFAAPCGDERCFDTCDTGVEPCDVACVPRYGCTQVLECVTACIARFDEDFVAQNECEGACEDQATAEQEELYDVLDLCSNQHACRSSDLGHVSCLFTHCTEHIIECTVVEEGDGDCVAIATCSQGCTAECDSDCAGSCGSLPDGEVCIGCQTQCMAECTGACFTLGTKDAQIQALQAFLCGEGLDCSDAPSESYCSIEHCGEGIVECTYGAGGAASCVDTGQCLTECAIDCPNDLPCYNSCQTDCLTEANTDSAVQALLLSTCLQAECPEGGLICLNGAMGVLGGCRADFVECCSSSGETNLAQCHFF